MDETILLDALMRIASDPSILNGLNMPNINFPTMGGHVMWNNLAEYHGWRIQENTLTHHCRILDPDDVRRAWGGVDAMDKVFKRLADSN